MTDERFYELMGVSVVSLKDSPDHVKCPRCWHYTHEGQHNHDGLCDRCCNVLLSDFPEHESIPHIKASREAQKQRWTVKA